MPIYEYYCDECKNKFEMMRRLSQSTEPATCPSCRKPARRIMSRCISMIDSGSGVMQPTAGSSSCSSCGSSNCNSCHS